MTWTSSIFLENNDWHEIGLQPCLQRVNEDWVPEEGQKQELEPDLDFRKLLQKEDKEGLECVLSALSEFSSSGRGLSTASTKALADKIDLVHRVHCMFPVI